MAYDDKVINSWISHLSMVKHGESVLILVNYLKWKREQAILSMQRTVSVNEIFRLTGEVKGYDHILDLLT